MRSKIRRRNAWLDDTRNQLRQHQEWLEDTKSKSEERIQHLEYTLATMKDQLLAKTEELQSANAFLSSIDDVSVADAQKELEVLNSEIYQFAAQISETLTFDRSSTSRSTFAEDQVVKELIGILLIEILLSADEDTHILAVQIAIQVALCSICHTIIPSWCVEDPSVAPIFQRLYDAFRLRSSHHIASCWRSLTASHLRTPETFTSEHLSLADQFAQPLARILLLAGWSVQPDEAPKKLLEKNRSKITVISNGALKLNKTFGEKVTSVDLATSIVSSGKMFDETSMKDAFEEAGTQHVVVGTTGLGIIQEKSKGNGQFERAVLLKPNVVVQSTLSPPDDHSS